MVKPSNRDAVSHNKAALINFLRKLQGDNAELPPKLQQGWLGNTNSL
jgi:hypothetical protein